MKCFYKGGVSSGRQLVRIILSICLLSLFCVGISGISKKTDEKQMESLETAVRRDIIHCYATEGNYPPSLEYLKEEYGLRYDESKFFVDYQVLGKNIMPDVTIIRK